VPRADLSAVEALRAAAGIDFSKRSIVVVGTNGKTSTAVFMERMVRSAGLRTGLTTSPHIRSWGERITIGGAAISEGPLLVELELLHRLASTVADSESLRFFDLLTLAAARVFADEAVDVSIYEAGIGGRLDATHLVGAPLVVLTSIGLDHEELLGNRELDVLREKLGVAHPGATVVSAELPSDLEVEAEAIAARRGLDLRMTKGLAGPFLARNAALALRALQSAPFAVGSLPDDVGSALAGGVKGRMQHFRANDVDVIVDAAHNPQAWEELRALLPAHHVALVSISRDRSATALAAVLSQAHHVLVTDAWPGRSYDPVELGSILTGAGLEVEVVAEPPRAFAAALHSAKSARLPLVVFGSAYLLPHALAVLDG
jgi:dihydrofolate synthase/folylpolyglutamate synthase